MTSTHELWQGYNDHAEPTRAITKPEAARGALHGSSHVWVWRQLMRNNPEILLQHRSDDVLTWPGFYDISIGGHIDAGDTPIKTAIKEGKEELGMDLTPDELKLIAVHRAHIEFEIPQLKIIENEFCWIYLAKIDEHKAIHPDPIEVDDIAWVGRSEFEDIVHERAEKKIVPHGLAYYALLLDAINYESSQ